MYMQHFLSSFEYNTLPIQLELQLGSQHWIQVQ